MSRRKKVELKTARSGFESPLSLSFPGWLQINHLICQDLPSHYRRDNATCPAHRTGLSSQWNEITCVRVLCKLWSANRLYTQNNTERRSGPNISAFHTVNFLSSWLGRILIEIPRTTKTVLSCLTQASTVSMRLSPTSLWLNQILDVAKKMLLLVKQSLPSRQARV